MWVGKLSDAFISDSARHLYSISSTCGSRLPSSCILPEKGSDTIHLDVARRCLLLKLSLALRPLLLLHVCASFASYRQQYFSKYSFHEDNFQPNHFTRYSVKWMIRSHDKKLEKRAIYNQPPFWSIRILNEWIHNNIMWTSGNFITAGSVFFCKARNRWPGIPFRSIDCLALWEEIFIR